MLNHYNALIILTGAQQTEESIPSEQPIDQPPLDQPKESVEETIPPPSEVTPTTTEAEGNTFGILLSISENNPKFRLIYSN
jgi:hypothetical protein